MKSEIKTDALLEVVNVGTGQAATALSQLLGQKVLINVPDMQMVSLSDVPGHLGGPERPIVGIYFTINGDLGGRILLLFAQESGHRLASMLTGEGNGSTMTLDEISRSSIMEMGNIIANSYLNGMAGLLDMSLLPSIPFYAEDMLGAVVDYLLIEIAEVADYALIINTQMSIESIDLAGSFLVFPDEVFMKKIFDKLGIGRPNG